MDEQEIEKFCQEFMEKVDDASDPESMSLEQAIEFWQAIRDEIVGALGVRISAAKEDLGEE